MSRPESYRLQPGCQGCRHVFVMSDYDVSEHFYCTLLAPPRPPCGSVGMGEYEHIDALDFSAYSDAIDAWLSWSDVRQVSSRGICDSYRSPEQGGDSE